MFFKNNYEIKFKFIDNKNVNKFYPNISKITKRLNWKPKVNIKKDILLFKI